MAIETENHWNHFYRCWSRLKAPLRPDADIVAAFSQILAPPAARTLLLGVTPELAFSDRDLVSVDQSRDMIEHVWPGDTERRTVFHGSWEALDFPPASFNAALGDGSLNVLSYPDGHTNLYRELAKVLTPGSLFALRIYATPENCESAEELAEMAYAGAFESFHGFKFRLAMSITAARGEPNIPVQLVLATFNELFPDRAHLVSKSGWAIEDIETIDIYKDSPANYNFPTVAQFKGAVSQDFTISNIAPSGIYDLAERCPIMVLIRK